MADDIDSILRSIIALDEDEIFVDASDNDVLLYIETLNRRQLIQGKNSEDELLSSVGGEYSDLTMEIAEAEGRPKSGKLIINLFSEGDYHSSIEAKVDKTGYTIISDPIKRDPLSGVTTNLLQRYGAEVEGLTEKSLDELIEKKLLARYVQVIEKKILQ